MAEEGKELVYLNKRISELNKLVDEQAEDYRVSCSIVKAQRDIIKENWDRLEAIRELMVESDCSDVVKATGCARMMRTW